MQRKRHLDPPALLFHFLSRKFKFQRHFEGISYNVTFQRKTGEKHLRDAFKISPFWCQRFKLPQMFLIA